MAFTDAATEHLLQRARLHDASAIDVLMERYRPQLRRAVAARIDRRLAGRVDPSDVVQEALVDASRQLDSYLRQPAVPFYPWLRAMAMNRLTECYRQHLLAQKRSVLREQAVVLGLSDDSVCQLANRFIAPTAPPDEQLHAQELHERVRAALDQLGDDEREVLISKYLEDMSSGEIAVVQGISERSVRRRHRQALERLARLLRDEESGQDSFCGK